MRNEGVPYFPVYCKADVKTNLITAEFGMAGFGVLMQLLTTIYSNGYYCSWTDDDILMSQTLWTPGTTLTADVAEAAIRRGIFSEEMYKKYKILTSAEIQTQYFEIVRRRKNVNADKRFLLIDISKFKNVSIIGENVDISSENDDIFEQRKVKESRVKESKEEENIFFTAAAAEKTASSQNTPVTDTAETRICKEYKKAGGIVTEGVRNRVREWLDAHSEDVICYAVKEAEDCGHCNLRYIDSILDRVRRERLTTVEQIRYAALRRKRKRFSDKDASIYQPNGTDYADLERRMNEKY